MSKTKVLYNVSKVRNNFKGNSYSAEMAINLFFEKAFNYCLENRMLEMRNGIKLEIINKQKTIFDPIEKFVVIYKSEEDIKYHEIRLLDKYKEKLITTNKVFRYVNQ